MLSHRLLVGLATLVAAALPTGRVSAATALTDEQARLVADAATVVAEERTWLTVLDPAFGESPAALRELARVDARGAELLERLQRLEVPLTAEARSALSPLDGSRPAPPIDSVYAVAVDDLVRMAAAPRIDPAGAYGFVGGVGMDSFVIVALLLVAAGLTGLLFAVRRSRPRRAERALAWIDALTGLANRRCLDRDIDDLATAAPATRGRVPDGPTSVIMIDIDHFKSINDRKGHRFGDEVIRRVGELLSREVRAADVVYRYGGEEFCVLLPGTPDHAAERVAQRLVDAARTLELPGGERITLSAGVAGGITADIGHTLEAADQALLAAKRGGRDRANRWIAGTATGIYLR